MTDLLVKYKKTTREFCAFEDNDTGKTKYPCKRNDTDNEFQIEVSRTKYACKFDNTSRTFYAKLPILTTIWSGQTGGGPCNDIDLDAFDGTGNLYFGESQSVSQIGKLDSDGDEVWTSDMYDFCKGVAVDSSGNVYGTSSGYTVHKFNSSGTEQWRISDGYIGNDVDIDSSGNVYLAAGYSSFFNPTYALWKFDSSGAEVWKKSLATNVSATRLAVDSSDNIYITTTKVGSSDTVFKYTSGGSETWSSDTSIHARGIAIDSSGNVYVAGDRLDIGGGEYASIWKFNSSGSLVLTADSGKSAYDVAVGSDGKIYVAQSGITDKSLTILNSSGEVLDTYDAFGSVARCIEVDTEGDIYIGGWNISGGGLRKIGYR